MKRYTLFLLALFILLCILIINAGRFLVFDELPKKSDVIVVLSGDKGERTVKGVELLREGFAPYVLFSGGIVYNNVTMADLMKKHAIELDVPTASILTEEKADSTYDNAVYSLAIMKQKGFKSAIIVSSNYHMRRVKFLFDREFKHSGITLTYVAAADHDFSPTRWWSNNKSIMETITEYIKFVGYALGKNT